MPIYEYICEKCGKMTEAVQKFSDPPLASCPHCPGTLKRTISRTSFQLKGSGWYASDYKKSSPASTEVAKPEASSTPATPATPEKKPTPEGGGKSS